MIALLLAAGLAVAQDSPTSETVVRAETLAQIRHDLYGQRYLPAYQYLRIDSQHGHSTFAGYAGLEAIEGVDRPADLDVYILYARGRAGRGDWTAGRQEATTTRRRQTFDGLRYTWSPSREIVVDAWGGVARHQDLDDLLDGTGMARATLTAARGPITVMVGGQVDGGPDTPLTLRQDLRARWTIGEDHPTRLEAVVAVLEPDASVEWARVDLYTPTWGRVDATLHAEHREAPDPNSLLGDAVLHDLAMSAVNEIGAQIQVHGARWSRVSAAYELSTYGGESAQWGHSVECALLPPLGATGMRLSPAYRFKNGPGGAFHALYATGTVDLPGEITWVTRAAAVPFRKGDAPWRFAGHLGAEARAPIVRNADLAVLADVASDTLYKLDLRVGAALTVEAR